MVIVLGIIAMLLGGAIFASKGILGTAKVGRADSDFKALTTNLMAYKNNNGFYPTTAQGLKALVEKPGSQPMPKRWTQIMTKMPIDPWDNDYIYRYPGSKIKTEPEIISKGPDGMENTDDDLSSQD